MVVIGIKTNEPEAEIWLAEEGIVKARKKWHAHRSLGTDLLPVITALLADEHKDLSAINRLVICNGPGSFTGLRIGIACANALAYSYNIPLVACTASEWPDSVQIAYGAKESDLQTSVLPVYGSPPHTTVQKK